MAAGQDYVPFVPPSGKSKETVLSFASGSEISNFELIVAGPPYQSYRIWTGSVTPGWKSNKRRQKRKLPINPHSVDRLVELTSSAYNRKVINHSWLKVLVDEGPPNPPYYKSVYGGSQVNWNLWCHACKYNNYVPTPVHDSNVYRTAVSRLQKRVRGSSVNVAQFFAERRQTMDLLSSTVWRVARAARALRKGNLGEVYHELGMKKGLSRAQEGRVLSTHPQRRLASHWLEVQYGVRPLLSDVHDAAELLAEHINTDRYHEKITSSATANVVWSNFTNGDFITVNGQRQQLSEGGETHSTTCRLNVHVRLDSSARQILGQTGISNPALLAWELLPYSFVVDWFLPVGNYLESLSAYDGWELIEGTVSNFTRVEYFRTANEVYSSYTNLGGGSGGTQSVSAQGNTKIVRYRYDRTPIGSLPSLGLPQLKSLDKALSPEHMLNGLALLRQVFGK